MKFSTIVGLLLALVVAVYIYKPAVFNRAVNTVGNKFTTKVKQISKPVVKGKNTKREQTKGLDLP